MESHSFPTLLLYSLLLLLLLISICNIQTTSATSSASSSSADNKRFVRQSCNSTSYPKDCYNFLSPYASKIQSNPCKLCEYAIYVAYVSANSASLTASRMSKTKGLTAAEKLVITDCVENFSNSVDELKNSWDDMDRAIGGNSTTTEEEKYRMVQDVKTWASAALTDDDTCKDEIDEAKVNPTMKSKLRKAILKVAKSTSIALAFINSYYT